MKKHARFLGAMLATVMAASVPAYAANVIMSDSFSKSNDKPWEVDIEAPQIWDTTENTLRVAAGRNSTLSQSGAIKTGPQELYAVQGKKLALQKPASDSWTASVKINVDDSWLSKSIGKVSAVFRVDMADSTGNAIELPAAIALQNRNNIPCWAIYNPEASDGWTYPKTYYGKQSSTETGVLRKELDVEEGWHTLYIKSDRGMITYQVDGKLLGSFDLGVSDAYPQAAALGVSPGGDAQFDSFALYNGNAGTVKKILTESEEEDRESSLEEKYASRRERWRQSHLEYLIKNASGEYEWVRASRLTEEQIENAYDSRYDGEMPDSYYDY